MVHLKRPEDKFACSRCNSSHLDIYVHEKHRHVSCLDCGYEETAPEPVKSEKFNGEKEF